jgi:3-isopropylmalate dehydratase small subunit
MKEGEKGVNNCCGSVHVLGDDINTDYIIPATYLALYEPEELGRHALEGLDTGYPERLAGAKIIFAGRNFGCGSAREQAPNALLGAGIQAVVARSFGRIFYRNAINTGLPVIECGDAVDQVSDGQEVTVDLERSKIVVGDAEFGFVPFPPHIMEILDAGGMMALLARRYGK